MVSEKGVAEMSVVGAFIKSFLTHVSILFKKRSGWYVVFLDLNHYIEKIRTILEFCAAIENHGFKEYSVTWKSAHDRSPSREVFIG